MVDANLDQQMEEVLNVTGDDPLSDAYGDERLISGQVPMERNPDLEDLTIVGIILFNVM